MRSRTPVEYSRGKRADHQKHPIPQRGIRHDAHVNEHGFLESAQQFAAYLSELRSSLDPES